jgi:hypothetical protein
VRVVDILVGVYLSGWVLAVIGVYVAGRHFSDPRSPAPHPLWVSLLAGAIWPLLIVGFVEISSVIVYTKVQSKPGPGVGILV